MSVQTQPWLSVTVAAARPPCPRHPRGSRVRSVTRPWRGKHESQAHGHQNLHPDFAELLVLRHAPARPGTAAEPTGLPAGGRRPLSFAAAHGARQYHILYSFTSFLVTNCRLLQFAKASWFSELWPQLESSFSRGLLRCWIVVPKTGHSPTTLSPIASSVFATTWQQSADFVPPAEVSARSGCADQRPGGLAVPPSRHRSHLFFIRPVRTKNRQPHGCWRNS